MKKITTLLLGLLLALPAMAVSIGGPQEHYGRPPADVTTGVGQRRLDPDPQQEPFPDFKMAAMPQYAALRKEATILQNTQSDKEAVESLTRLYAILDQPGVRQEISNRLWAKQRRMSGHFPHNISPSDIPSKFVSLSWAPSVYKDGIITVADQWKATVRKLQEDRARMRAQAYSNAKPLRGAAAKAEAEARSRAARAKPRPKIFDKYDVWPQWQVAILATWAAEEDMGHYPAPYRLPDAPPKADKK